MTVIAFPPRSAGSDGSDAGRHLVVTGTFRTPRGRSGEMDGILRVTELRQGPSGLRLTGVFTAELREADGTFIGLDSRRATLATELVRQERGSEVVIGPLDLDLMGLTVHVEQFMIRASEPFPPADGPTVDRRARGRQGGEPS